MELPDLIMFIGEKFSKMEKLCENNLKVNGSTFSYEFINPVKKELKRFDNGEISHYNLDNFNNRLLSLTELGSKTITI